MFPTLPTKDGLNNMGTGSTAIAKGAKLVSHWDIHVRLVTCWKMATKSRQKKRHALEQHISYAQITSESRSTKIRKIEYLI